MPQGRRKTPFSNKQKKLQLQNKRDQKKSGAGVRGRPHYPPQASNRRPFVSDDGDIEDELDDDSLHHQELGEDQSLDSTTIIVNKESDQFNALGSKIKSVNVQNNVSANRDVNRYALQFFTESDQEIRDRKERAQQPFKFLGDDGLVCTVEEMFGETVDLKSGIPVTDVDMPKRPEWHSDMTPQELNSQEQKYFNNYLNELFAKSTSEHPLSYFDLNLETWRQLWRVIEMSDIVLLISDIRHPIFHFPPSLYHYVVDEKDKHMILVLNKIDLVDAGLVVAWQEYLKNKFPKLIIIEFASYAGMKVRSSSGKRVGKLHMAVKGALSLQKTVAQIVGDAVDLSSWKLKIEKGRKEAESSLDDDSSYCESDEEEDDDDRRQAFSGKTNKGTARAQLENRASKILIEKADTSYYCGDKFKNGIVTLGLVGHPNVGKSSLLNALCGKKFVSVSRTPGHTKHFQTIFLTDEVRLCDCPGLVFPSHAPKALQVLMGCYPIAQLREPYTAIRYLAERVNLVRILRLQHPEGDTENDWTAFDICEAWAEKRGFLTSRTARPDVYRAANHLLRMALDGRTINLSFYPPNYLEKGKDFWASHPRRKEVENIQNRKLVQETLNKNLMRQCHGPGYVDSHASSVEADLDDDDDDEDGDSEGGQFRHTVSRFARLVEVDGDDEDVEA